MRGVRVKSVITSITGRDMEFGIVSFNVNTSDIVIVSSQGQYSTYNVALNVTTREHVHGTRATFLMLAGLAWESLAPAREKPD